MLYCLQGPTWVYSIGMEGHRYQSNITNPLFCKGQALVQSFSLEGRVDSSPQPLRSSNIHTCPFKIQRGRAMVRNLCTHN